MPSLVLFFTMCMARADDDDSDDDGDGWSEDEGDCDDDDNDDYPDADEECDGDDNDCDGDVPLDERDLDNDGFLACDDDCDDVDRDVNPDAREECDDDIDNDCDHAVDEGCGPPPQTETEPPDTEPPDTGPPDTDTGTVGTDDTAVEPPPTLTAPGRAPGVSYVYPSAGCGCSTPGSLGSRWMIAVGCLVVLRRRRVRGPAGGKRRAGSEGGPRGFDESLPERR